MGTGNTFCCLKAMLASNSLLRKVFIRPITGVHLRTNVEKILQLVLSAHNKLLAKDYLSSVLRSAPPEKPAQKSDRLLQ